MKNYKKIKEKVKEYFLEDIKSEHNLKSQFVIDFYQNLFCKFVNDEYEATLETLIGSTHYYVDNIIQIFDSSKSIYKTDYQFLLDIESILNWS